MFVTMFVRWITDTSQKQPIVLCSLFSTEPDSTVHCKLGVSTPVDLPPLSHRQHHDPSSYLVSDLYSHPFLFQLR